MAIVLPTNADTDRYDVQVGTGDTLTFDVPTQLFAFSGYFDASDAGPTDSAAAWTDDAFAFDGSFASSARQAETDAPGILKGTGTNAPTSGGFITNVYCRTKTFVTIQPWTLLSVPSGGWSWTKIAALHLEYDASAGVNPKTVKAYVSDGGTLLGTMWDVTTANFVVFGTEIAVFGLKTPDKHALILATGDDDDISWTPPTNFVEFLEVNNATNDDASVGAWYAKASDITSPTVELVRSGSEEQVGIMMLVEGADLTDFEDLAFSEGTHFVATNNVDGTPNVTPQPIDTATDDALVIILTGNRSNTNHWGGSGTTWDVDPPTGYAIEAATNVASNNTAGAPGRLKQGEGAGDAMFTWMWKTVTSAGTETPGQITGFTGARDHLTVTFAIRPAVAGGTNFEETATDDADITDDTLRVHDAERTSTDDADVTDDTLRVHNAERSATDPADVTDQVQPRKITQIAVTETVGVEDATAVALMTTVTVTETVGITDATARVAPAVRVVTDPVGLIDATTRAEENAEASVETVAVTDSTVRVVPTVRSSTDPVGVTDAVAPVKTITATVTEDVGVADQTTRVAPAERTATDNAAVTDETLPAKTITVTDTDPVGVTDLAVGDLTAGGINYTRIATDPVGATDATLPAKTVPVTTTDPVGVTDVVSSVKVVVQTATDDAGVTDQVSPVKTIQVTVTDPAGVTDQTSRVALAVRVVTDSIDVQDQVQSDEQNVEQSVEAVGITDSTSRVHEVKRTVTDAIGVTDLAIDDLTIPTVETEIRPVSDVSTAGWDTAPTASQPLWEQLDEEMPSDVDYVFAEAP